MESNPELYINYILSCVSDAESTSRASASTTLTPPSRGMRALPDHSLDRSWPHSERTAEVTLDRFLPQGSTTMTSRRDLLSTALRGSALVALSPTVPGFLERTARGAGAAPDARILVVIELSGGNDGINTIVPFADEGYTRYRKELRLATHDLIKISDGIALNPAMGDAAKLLEQGRLAIVQGVGYPNPNRSHFESMAIWQSARFDPEERKGTGWLGSSLDNQPQAGARTRAAAMFIGSGPPPLALRGRRAVASALERIDDFSLDKGADARRLAGTQTTEDDLAAFVRRSMLDAYATADRVADLARAGGRESRYPATGLAGRLRTVAGLIKAGLGSRVFYTTQGSYDTHVGQLQTHPALLSELFSAIRSFLDDMAASGLAQRVAVLCFSEFGRRVSENGSAGTDHGSAGPVFIAGESVNAGLLGTYPSLTDLEDGDLKSSTDFRRVYASVLEQWLALPSGAALAGQFAPMALFRT
jgi:uncharacterized protein (DUF1501 family)